MGTCKYCGQKAGIFKDAHAQCLEEAQAFREKFCGLVKSVASGDIEINSLASLLSLQENGKKDPLLRPTAMSALDHEVLRSALDSPIATADADRITEVYKLLTPEWSMEAENLVKWPGFVSMLHSNNLFQILHRELPYVPPGMSSGFRLRDGEQPILRRYATLAEYRNVSPGHSFQSLSVPIGYGMYYRIGASNPKTGNIGLVPVDSGLMLITTHAIYFGGDRETFRIDYDSILRLEAYKDGFGLHQNYGSAKVFTPSPIISVDEGWYFYNLIDSLSKW